MDLSDDSMDFIIDNTILNVQEILPKFMRFEFVAETDDSEQFSSKMRLKISKIRADARNVLFYVNKKTFPKLEDGGLADLYIRGRGLELDVVIAPLTEEERKQRNPAQSEKIVTYTTATPPSHEYVESVSKEGGAPPTGSFRVEKVKCTIHHMSLSIHDSQHE